MTALTAILTVLGIAGSLWMFYAKRKAATNDDPIEQGRKAELRTEKVLASDDPNAVSLELNDRLDRLERLRIANGAGVERTGIDCAGGGGKDDHGHQ